MPTLRKIITEQGGVDPTANNTINEVSVPLLNPMDLLGLQAAFGQLITGNPELCALVNKYGPILFATTLFTLCEAYDVDPNDPESVIPTKSATEAENEAIGWIRGVASAMGMLSEDITNEPTDAEVDADTDIEAVA
jgi:hypothetical protein